MTSKLPQNNACKLQALNTFFAWGSAPHPPAGVVHRPRALFFSISAKSAARFSVDHVRGPRLT
eukprot:1376159-Prymnesium_polylepis.1